MPKMSKASSKPLEFTPKRRKKALIDWNDPSKQAHVLDWRHRAQEFGLAVDTHEELEDGQRFAPTAAQILHDEEPEAFEDQAVRAEPEEEEQAGAAMPAGREDVDLVRVYLQH